MTDSACRYVHYSSTTTGRNVTEQIKKCFLNTEINTAPDNNCMLNTL